MKSPEQFTQPRKKPFTLFPFWSRNDPTIEAQWLVPSESSLVAQNWGFWFVLHEAESVSKQLLHSAVESKNKFFVDVHT